MCAKFGHNMLIDAFINPFRRKLQNFCRKRVTYPRKPDFFRCVSVGVLYRTDKFWVKMTIPSCPRAKHVRWFFVYHWPFWTYFMAKVPKIYPTQLCLQFRIVQDHGLVSGGKFGYFQLLVTVSRNTRRQIHASGSVNGIAEWAQIVFLLKLLHTLWSFSSSYFLTYFTARWSCG